MRHYIDEGTGDLPEVIPERVLTLAAFFGAIVAWVTDHLPDGGEHTNVPCRRSPGRPRCRGDIIAQLDRLSGYIVWQCPLCGDHGISTAGRARCGIATAVQGHCRPLDHRDRGADAMPVSDRGTLEGLTQFPRTAAVGRP
jgi:hypothetical protein